MESNQRRALCVPETRSHQGLQANASRVRIITRLSSLTDGQLSALRPACTLLRNGRADVERRIEYGLAQAQALACRSYCRFPGHAGWRAYQTAAGIHQFFQS